jgi:hypothetical protein
MTADGGFSCLYVSAQEGHLEVVKGGRELVMLTTDNGESCLFISAANGHLEAVKALLEAGGCELAMMTRDEPRGESW